MYVSFSPPALVIAVHPGSRTCRLIEASGEFSVSLLADDQAARPSPPAGRHCPDKFAAVGLRPSDLRRRGPAVDGVPLVAWCRVTHRYPAGDHVVFVGEVIDHRRAADAAQPLLRQRRRYARRGEWLADERPDGYPT
jgi:flavin reductase (DIM6/NTAB) family NADH-FMN oxidoreductase RutF